MQVATKPTASGMSATLNKAATLELIQLDDKAATESGLDNCDNEAGGDATPSNNIDTHGGHRTLPPGAESDVGAEGVDQALDVGQFGQPRLSAVDELHAREGGVALDFRVDNPLANVRDAGAGAAVAVAVAVAGRPQSATFVAVPPTDKFSRIAMTGSSHNEGSHTRPCTTPGDGTRNRGSSWMSTDMRTAARSVSRRGTGEDGSTSVTERGTGEDESTSTNLRRTSIEVGEDEKM